jgi:hypothetical protein
LSAQAAKGHRIAVITPVYGDPQSASVKLQYAHALYGFSEWLDAFVGDAFFGRGEVRLDPKAISTDVVHARSEGVRRFLEHPAQYTHALWWDEDVWGTQAQITACLLGMLRCPHEIVTVPYPQKRLDFAYAAKVLSDYISNPAYEKTPITGEELEAFCTPHYAFNFLQSTLKEQDSFSCYEVDWAPIGFSLWKRSALEKMVAAYKDTLSYRTARYDENYKLVLDEDPTVAMFMLEHEQGGELRHEDYSFCRRWRSIGGKLHLYMGSGSPLSHVGTHIFRGSPLASMSNPGGEK